LKGKREMIYSNDTKAYRIPRWNELPDLELYMDQVISVLDKYLALFIDKEDGGGITSTMINNYVKQKLVEPPKNKKYNKGHIASFFIITLMKQIMSISEINIAISTVADKLGREKGYDLFCESFESSLEFVFIPGTKVHKIKCEDPEAYEIVRSITLAYANMLYARNLLKDHLPNEEPKESKKEKKEKKK